MNDKDKDIVCILGLLLSPVLLGYVLPNVVMEIGYILFNGKSPLSLLALAFGVLITAIILLIVFNFRDREENTINFETINFESTLQWKICAKCGHKINIVAKKCPYCSNTSFKEYHEPKPVKTEKVRETRKKAHDTRLYMRQKELAKKYNEENYKDLIGIQQKK